MPSKIHIALSIALHCSVALVLLVGLPPLRWGDRPPQLEESEELEESQELIEVWADLVDATERKLAPSQTTEGPKEQQPEMSLGQIEYAGAPARARIAEVVKPPEEPGQSSDQTTAEKRLEESTQVSNVDSPSEETERAAQEPVAKKDPLNEATKKEDEAAIAIRKNSQQEMERAQATQKAQNRHVGAETLALSESAPLGLVFADAPRPDGMRAPSFVVTGLDRQQMDQIVQAKQGVYIAFCADKYFALRESLEQPSSLSPVAARDLAGFSIRALPVPSSRNEKIADTLMWNYSFSKDDLKKLSVRLFLINALDTLILQRQRQAADRLAVQLEDIEQTWGVFVFAQHRVVDFQITSLVFRDGRTLQVVKNEVGQTENRSALVRVERE